MEDGSLESIPGVGFIPLIVIVALVVLVILAFRRR